MTNPEDIQSGLEIVRMHDPDRYLTALMAPRRVRGALMALYAFNAEIARIPTLVSEPALGEIRLQWWRDAVDNMGAASTSGAPIATALSKAISMHDLPKPFLIGMIDARSADLDGGGLPDLQALKAYLYKSEGAVFALSARILGATDARTSSKANAAGLAFGLTKLLRMLASDAAAGKVMLPLSMLESHGIRPEQVLSGTCAQELKPVLAELADEARAACHQITDIERVARPAFAPLALVEPYLKALDQADHNALRNIADINPLVRFWRLWRAS